ncbi:SDR family NAD(P)-dependent oxidoreductase [Dongia sp.]|uniref:SDR family NAD(P)-dependent oxidoreductase n=1 Tax=Dongia sp. TaxID=1977262 RepID=UPI0035B341F3
MRENGKAKSVLVVGATSAIAEHLARIFATEGAHLLLVARHAGRLQAVADNLRLLGAAAVDCEIVAAAVDADAAFARLAAHVQGTIDYVFVAQGYLGDQAEALTNDLELAEILEANLSSVVRWMAIARRQLLHQGHGALIVFGSVAGDRGRRANYVYGAAKAAVATLAEGMAHEFANAGPRSIVVKIGPTDTPMTASFDKKGPLWAQPRAVAAAIRRAADGRRPVVYVPGFWRWIMLAIRMLPTAVFNRLSI